MMECGWFFLTSWKNYTNKAIDPTNGNAKTNRLWCNFMRDPQKGWYPNHPKIVSFNTDNACFWGTSFYDPLWTNYTVMTSAHRRLLVIVSRYPLACHNHSIFQTKQRWGRP